MEKKPARAIEGHWLQWAEVMWDRNPPAGYPFDIPAIRSLRGRLDLHPRVTFLVGENGSGKSTLLEALAVAFGCNPEGGGRNFNFATQQTHSHLCRFLRLGKSILQANDAFFVRAESMYNVANIVDKMARDRKNPRAREIYKSYGGKSLHAQSHGESFMALFENRFFGNGMYFLDEPEAALSPSRQLTFLSLLHDHCRTGMSQFVIATHSPILLAYPDSLMYAFGPEGLSRTTYEETEHYKVTKQFLTHTRVMLEALMEDR